MNYVDDNRIVSANKTQKALNLGNLNGVRRLANFVGCSSVYPVRVYEACENQRLEWFYRNKK